MGCATDIAAPYPTTANDCLAGDLFNQLRLGHTRNSMGRDVHLQRFESADSIKNALAQLLMVMDRLDQVITPMVLQDGDTFSRRWGYLSIAGVNDKSQLQRQIEKYADIYMSRVGNFGRCAHTPCADLGMTLQPCEPNT